jgi:hypothetical protein
MKKLYKNDVHRIIKEEMNLDPSRFTIKEEMLDGKPLATLSIIDSEMEFTFLNPVNSWDVFKVSYTYFSPDFRKTNLIPHEQKFMPYDETKKHLINWLRDQVKPFFEDREGVDLWDTFQFETNIFQLTQVTFGDNSSFSLEESTKIVNAIDNLKQLIVERFDATEEQAAFIEERLDYVNESVNRLGKYDWTGLMVSTFISIGINMGVDTETGRTFFQLISDTFKTIRYIFTNQPLL